MRNVRKICIAILVSIIICYACASDMKPAENIDNNELRLRRHNKKPENSSESVKKPKQQQKESEALTRSQLTLSPSSAVNTVGDLTAIESNVEPIRSFLRNGHLQMRQLNNPLNVGGAFNYAFNYPYEGYPTQTLSPFMHQVYLFGNQNVPSHHFEKGNNDFALQPSITNFVNGQPHYAHSYAPNVIEFTTGQPGLTQYGQPNTQPNFRPSFENNLIRQATLPYTQANLPYNFGAYGEHISKQYAPSDYMNIYGSNFIASGSLPDDVSGIPLLQPSQLSQPIVLKPQLDLVHFGAVPQNEINNGFGVPGGLIPNFMRNQRMLGANNKE